MTMTEANMPTNIRLGQGGKPVKSVHHTLTSGIPWVLRNLPKRAERWEEVQPDDLADLRALHDVIEEAMGATIAVLRDQGYSWGDIGAALGVTRQSAQMTYGRRP